jgi:hypothetical protein
VARACFGCSGKWLAILEKMSQIKLTGALLIVVPNFARESFVISHCALYRLSAAGHWTVNVILSDRVSRQ